MTKENNMFPNVGANLTRVENLKKSNNSSFLIETCGSRIDFFPLYTNS